MSASFATQLAAAWASAPEEQRREAMASFSAAELEAIPFIWAFHARPDQLPPAGDWRTWLLLGGRGSGKTRSAAEWCRAEVESGRRRYLGIVGPTADSLRKVQVEGPSGIVSTSPPWNRASYEPSTRRITWQNGAVAHLFSAEEPERLRGPNLDGAWCDEIVAWANLEATWDMLQLAMRLPGPLGDAPRCLVSTTPKSLPWLRTIMAADDTVITRARTQDNAANLDSSTVAYLMRRYGGTSLGRQELDAELIDDLEGALWKRSLIEDARVAPRERTYQRIVVAIDPAGGASKTSDETGIVVAARGFDGDAYVLADLSGRYSPEGWATVAVRAFQDHKADRIVAEANFGGAMVEATLRAVNRDVPVRMVHASRGKQIRAEPIVALYEQGKVHHVGNFPKLEDQMCQWDPRMSGSPDRVDALVWGITELTATDPPQGHRFVYLPYLRRG